jgi:hypothetical protein
MVTDADRARLDSERQSYRELETAARRLLEFVPMKGTVNYDNAVREIHRAVTQIIEKGLVELV